MVDRSLAMAAIVAVLAACSGEDPRRSSASSASDPAATAPVQAADTSAPPAPSRPEPGPRLLTADGWGPLRIGMTRAEVVAAAGEDANPGAVGGPDPETCDEFRPREAPEGVLVMIRDGVLTRVSVSRNPEIRTPEGLGVGDPGSSVLAEYGARARVEPHPYWAPPGKYVTVWRQTPPGSERRGIRYEIGSDDKVVHVRAGGPSIEAAEGCV